MKLFTYNKKKLIIVTITEVILLAVIISTAALTFDYAVEVALNGFTSPWLGDNSAEIASKYNVSLMNALSLVSNVSLIMWSLVNVFRFIIIKPKYKLFCGIGVAIDILAVLLFSNISIPNTISWVLFLIAAGFIIYSHKIDKEEEIKQC